MSEPNKMMDLFKNDPIMESFINEGAKLIEKENEPNVITYDQFLPYIDLFNADEKRYNTDEEYKKRILTLNHNWYRRLGINPYNVTIVIASETDRRPLYFLDRRFTRLQSDNKVERSARLDVQDNIPKSAQITRDQVLLNATFADVVTANTTEEQKQVFAKVKAESALFRHLFIQHNLPENKRQQMIEEKQTPAASEITPDSVEFDDD